jgi:YHS domain-containing protein
MGILLWIVRILALLLLVRFVLQLLFGNRRQRTAAGGGFGRRGRPGPEAKPGGELVRDPHCGTYVPKARAIAVSVGHETFYFCSTACRDAYRAKASA